MDLEIDLGWVGGIVKQFGEKEEKTERAGDGCLNGAEPASNFRQTTQAVLLQSLVTYCSYGIS